jgi:6-phosphogluconolactonase/glucosamine-6-phosphate isomerase/deaminase
MRGYQTRITRKKEEEGRKTRTRRSSRWYIFNNRGNSNTTNIFVTAAQNAIQKQRPFVVALTGGSSPVAIYKLWQPPYKAKIDWQNVFVFWGDELGAS